MFNISVVQYVYCSTFLNLSHLEDEVVGVVICNVETKDEEETAVDGIFPVKFKKLNRFFDDLKRGIDLFETVDVLVLSTMFERFI